MSIYRNAAFTLLTLAAIGFTGCSGETTETTPETPEAPETTQTGEPAGEGHAHSHSADELEKMKVAMAKLSPEDAESAMEQHHCPVGGGLLGAMGVPKKVDVNGTPVWICCDNCKEPLLADPETYLAKLSGSTEE